MTNQRGTQMSSMLNEARSRLPRFAEAAVERARLTVVPRTVTHRAARVPFVTLVSLLLVAGVAGLLFFNTSMQQVSFTATALEHKAQVLDAERQGLQMDLDSLRSPQRVAQQAKRMGMVPAASPAFLRLPDGKVLGEPAPATWEDAVKIKPMPTRKPLDLRPPPRTVMKRLPGTGTATGTGSRAPARAPARGQPSGLLTREPTEGSGRRRGTPSSAVADGRKKTHHRDPRRALPCPVAAAAAVAAAADLAEGRVDPGCVPCAGRRCCGCGWVSC